MRGGTPLTIVLAAAAGLTLAAQQDRPLERTRYPTRFISYSEARPILDRLAPPLAAALAARADSERGAAWLAWVAQRDAEIRARVERGDEDSLINLLLFGTSFTTLPRATTEGTRRGGPERAADIVRGRIADLVRAVGAPGGNDRLRFAAEVVARRGIDPATAMGREQARAYLVSLMNRGAKEAAIYVETLDAGRAQGRGELAVRSTLYRTRGLSSDTSIRPDFAIDRALDGLRARGVLAAGSVQRVAVIGPGLDFTDKAEGHDFYPQQTTQPFSIIDSLRRRRLAHADGVTLATIDLSPRVNGHLRAAQQRAGGGAGYVLMLPRERNGGWARDMVAFWREAGSGIGEETRGIRAPPEIDLRAVRVRPDVVRSLRVHDLNVVVERLDPPPDGGPFDLVIATNVLVYYDVFEQSLALANVAAMLRPGGLLLSNNVLVELPETPIRSIGHTDAIYSERPDDRDQIVWYRRQDVR